MRSVSSSVGTFRRPSWNMKAERLDDTWLVVGQWTSEQERLTVKRSWVVGRRTGRVALILQFAAGSQPFADPLVTGEEQPGTLGVLSRSFRPAGEVSHAATGPLRRSRAVLPGTKRLTVSSRRSPSALGTSALVERLRGRLARRHRSSGARFVVGPRSSGDGPAGRRPKPLEGPGGDRRSSLRPGRRVGR